MKEPPIRQKSIKILESDVIMNNRVKPRFIAYQKLTKKKRRELDTARRGTWGTVNPVTKRAEPSTAYQREKEKRRWQVEPDHSGIFFAFPPCARIFRIITQVRR